MREDERKALYRAAQGENRKQATQVFALRLPLEERRVVLELIEYFDAELCPGGDDDSTAD